MNDFTEPKLDAFQSNAKKIDDEYEAFHALNRKLPVEKRAENMNIPDLVWSAHTDKPMPDDIKEQIIERQKIWLTENPLYIYANPTCYRDIVEPQGDRLKNKFRASLMAVVERVLFADKREAKRIKIKI